MDRTGTGVEGWSSDGTNLLWRVKQGWVRRGGAVRELLIKKISIIMDFF